MKHKRHIHIYILIGLILLGFMLILINIQQEKYLSQNVTFGLTFTPHYAESLGLNPRETYLSMLNDLKVKNLRLSAYWDDIEPVENKFTFTDLDWYIDQAEKNNAQVILAIGYKLPRWPECREPEWLEEPSTKQVSNSFRQQQLTMLETVINHYENNPTITAFQLENEPLLDFGVCPPHDRDFLHKEVNFVKSKTQKPIIITDTGELRPWKTPMQLSDIFGTTLYRVVDSPWIGPFQYPLRPFFYRVKSDLIRTLFAQNNQKTIISELQAEPWGDKDQIDRFDIFRFKDTIEFSRRTGFTEVYLWGVEWWYYMNENNHPEYLNYSRTLF
jgi:hypothetical protein